MRGGNGLGRRLLCQIKSDGTSRSPSLLRSLVAAVIAGSSPSCNRDQNTYCMLPGCGMELGNKLLCARK